MTRHGMWKRGSSVGLLLALAGGTSGRVTSWLAPPVAAQSSGGPIVVTSTAQEVTVSAPNGVANGNCTLGEACWRRTRCVRGRLSGQGRRAVHHRPATGPNLCAVAGGELVVRPERAARSWRRDDHRGARGDAAGAERDGAAAVLLRRGQSGRAGNVGVSHPGAGSLTLREVTLTGGRQHGGDSNQVAAAPGWAAPSSTMACCSSIVWRCATTGHQAATPTGPPAISDAGGGYGTEPPRHDNFRVRGRTRRRIWRTGQPAWEPPGLGVGGGVWAERQWWCRTVGGGGVPDGLGGWGNADGRTAEAPAAAQGCQAALLFTIGRPWPRWHSRRRWRRGWRRRGLPLAPRRLLAVPEDSGEGAVARALLASAEAVD